MVILFLIAVANQPAILLKNFIGTSVEINGDAHNWRFMVLLLNAVEIKPEMFDNFSNYL
jgi:hypothetical protein